MWLQGLWTRRWLRPLRTRLLRGHLKGKRTAPGRLETQRPSWGTDRLGPQAAPAGATGGAWRLTALADRPGAAGACRTSQGLPRGAAPKAAGTRDALSVFTLRSPCRRRPNFLNSSTLGIGPPFLVLQQGSGFLSHLCTANSCLPMPGSPPRMPRAHGFPTLGPRPARGAGNEAPGNSASRSVPAEAFRFGVRSPSALRSSKP